jgi:hypothetical protein
MFFDKNNSQFVEKIVEGIFRKPSFRGLSAISAKLDCFIDLRLDHDKIIKSFDTKDGYGRSNDR